MALTMYMSITGKNQGSIKGGCTQAGDKKDKILVYAFEHEIEIPNNPHDGLPVGQRIHKPLGITKAVDVASPALLKAQCSGEHLDEVKLDFYKILPTGEESLYYTIKLEEAVIVHKKAYTKLTFVEENKSFMDMEDIKFSYSKITVTYTDGNIEATDSWKES